MFTFKKMSLFRKSMAVNKQSKEEGMSTRPGRGLIRKLLRVFAIILAVLIVIAGAGYLWAATSTDTSLIARGIMWGDARADDWKRYPSREIKAGPEPFFFNDKTAAFHTDITIDGKTLEQYAQDTNTTAFLLIQGDDLLYEGYFNGSGHEATQSSLSAAKSFVSTLVGIAIEEGFIGSLDDPITDYIPELLERDGRFADITLHHLITMSAGLRFIRDESDPFSDDFITSASPDLRAAALDSQIVEAPGVIAHYNDYNPLLVGMALERATGMSVSKYMESRLWGPMGAEADGSWDMDSLDSGFEKMSVGINGRAIDFAKLGWLYLNGGINGHQQVLPASWVEEATRADDATDPARQYQYFWWVDEPRGAYYAEGNFCQYIYVYPVADLILVRHGNECGNGWFTDTLGDMAAYFAQELAS